MEAGDSDPYRLTSSDLDTELPKVEEKEKVKKRKEKKERHHSHSPNPKGTTDVSKDKRSPENILKKSKSKKAKDDVPKNLKMPDYYPVTPKSKADTRVEDAPTGNAEPEQTIYHEAKVAKTKEKAKKKKSRKEPSQDSVNFEVQNQEHVATQAETTELKPKKKENSDLSSRTTHQLLNHPGLLSAGCVLLQNLKTNKMTAEEVGKKIGLRKGPRLRSDDGFSQNKTKASTSTSVGSSESKPKTSKARKHKSRDPDPEHEDPNSGDEANDEGLAVLRELIKRSAVSMTDPVDEDGDLNEGLAGALFGNIDAKKKLVLIHTKVIQKLTPLRLKEVFAKVLSEVAAIYEGSHPSIRHEKFKLGRSEDKRLKELHVTYPFNQVQSGTVIDLIYQSFFQDKSRRHNWSNYVNDVLVPETFIRIYAYVNHIDNESAEKELLYAEEYEGPVHTHLRKKQRNAREKQLMDLAESQESRASASGSSRNGNGNGSDSEESINDEVLEMNIDEDASNSSIEEISAMLL